MTVYARSPILRVYIDSREVTQRFSARARHDLAQRTASAEIAVPVVPSWSRCYDPHTGNGSIVSIFMGPDEATAYRRFVGYLVQLDYSLWPRSVNLVCRGLLTRAEQYEQPDPDGVDLAGVSGATDQAMWETLLDACGLTQAYLNSIGCSRTIQGTGTTVGLQVTSTDPDGNLIGPFAWGFGVSALSKGDEIDKAFYPYRLCEFAGDLLRVPIQIDNASPSHTFTEGVDIFSGQSSEVWLERKNQVVVTGYDDGLGLGPVTASYPPAAPTPLRAYPFSSDKIEFETAAEATAAGNGLSCETVARAIYPDQFRALVKVEGLQVPSGAIIWPTQPIKVQGAGGIVDRLGLSQILWCQAAECGVSERAEWTQTLTALGGKTGTAPTTLPPIPSFSVELHVETIVSGGIEVPLYIVRVTDTSIPMGPAITGWAWTATGGTPSSGTASALTTAYTDISGKSISLTVTAADGQTATLSKALPPATSVLWTRRPLYLASTTVAEANDGSTWRTDAESVASNVTAVGNGPIWGAQHTAMRSLDYLATSATESTPQAATNVTALWVETDVSTSRILAGLADGSVYLSTDNGATWTQLGSPEASAILRVVINRYATGQYFALTANGYYDTVDGGATWSLRNAAPTGHTFYDVAHSWDRGYLVVGDDGAGNPYAVDSEGNEQTLTGCTAGLYAVTARILGGYAAIASDGTTWTSGSGEATFAAAEPLPGGCTALPRSLARDGAIPDLFYIAGGTSGAWKSIDGFGSAGGYYQIRAPGVGNCPADADIVQIGADGLLAAGPITPVTIYSDDVSVVLSLWNGTGNDAAPADWYTPGFDDSAWAAATEGIASSEVSGATDIWDASLSDDAEQLCIRRTFTAGDGFISGASYEFACDGAADHWINNMFLAHTVAGYTSPTTIAIPPDMLINGTNVLAIHVLGAV